MLDHTEAELARFHAAFNAAVPEGLPLPPEERFAGMDTEFAKAFFAMSDATDLPDEHQLVLDLKRRLATETTIDEQQKIRQEIDTLEQRIEYAPCYGMSNAVLMAAKLINFVRTSEYAHMEGQDPNRDEQLAERLVTLAVMLDLDADEDVEAMKEAMKSGKMPYDLAEEEVVERMTDALAADSNAYLAALEPDPLQYRSHLAFVAEPQDPMEASPTTPRPSPGNMPRADTPTPKMPQPPAAFRGKDAMDKSAPKMPWTPASVLNDQIEAGASMATTGGSLGGGAPRREVQPVDQDLEEMRQAEARHLAEGEEEGEEGEEGGGGEEEDEDEDERGPPAANLGILMDEFGNEWMRLSKQKNEWAMRMWKQYHEAKGGNLSRKEAKKIAETIKKAYHDEAAAKEQAAAAAERQKGLEQAQKERSTTNQPVIDEVGQQEWDKYTQEERDTISAYYLKMVRAYEQSEGNPKVTREQAAQMARTALGDDKGGWGLWMLATAILSVGAGVVVEGFNLGGLSVAAATGIVDSGGGLMKEASSWLKSSGGIATVLGGGSVGGYVGLSFLKKKWRSKTKPLEGEPKVARKRFLKSLRRLYHRDKMSFVLLLFVGGLSCAGLWRILRVYLDTMTPYVASGAVDVADTALRNSENQVLREAYREGLLGNLDALREGAYDEQYESFMRAETKKGDLMYSVTRAKSLANFAWSVGITDTPPAGMSSPPRSLLGALAGGESPTLRLMQQLGKDALKRMIPKLSKLVMQFLPTGPTVMAALPYVAALAVVILTVVLYRSSPTAQQAAGTIRRKLAEAPGAAWNAVKGAVAGLTFRAVDDNELAALYKVFTNGGRNGGRNFGNLLDLVVAEARVPGVAGGIAASGLEVALEVKTQGRELGPPGAVTGVRSDGVNTLFSGNLPADPGPWRYGSNAGHPKHWQEVLIEIVREIKAIDTGWTNGFWNRKTRFSRKQALFGDLGLQDSVFKLEDCMKGGLTRTNVAFSTTMECTLNKVLLFAFRKPTPAYDGVIHPVVGKAPDADEEEEEEEEEAVVRADARRRGRGDRERRGQPTVQLRERDRSGQRSSMVDVVIANWHSKGTAPWPAPKAPSRPPPRQRRAATGTVVDEIMAQWAVSKLALK